jgi:glycosyltransferase involved in cell wall biosynthesis
MKICLLHYSAPPVVGGVESVLAEQAQRLAQAGHTVRVSAGRGAAWSAAVEFVPVPLMDSRHPEVLAVKAHLDRGQVPAEFDRLQAALADALRPALAAAEVVIAHNIGSLSKNLALTAALHELAAAPGAARLVLWHHDLAWTTPRYRAELHPGHPWDLLRIAWPGATQVVVSALRQRELAQLMGLALDQIHIIPNGIDARRFFKLEAQTTELMRRLDLFQAAPLLLLPVRVTRRKNIELALRMLAHLRRELPAAQLVVTGPLGPHNPANVEYFAQLTALRAELGLAEAAHFLCEQAEGFLPDSVIADFYRLADALFLPSREEGFGLPILEAAFSRLPIFCTDTPGMPSRELGGAEAAYFSPDDDPAAVAQLVAAYLAASPLYRLAVRARSHYSWERIYHDHLEPLLNVGASDPPGPRAGGQRHDLA